MKSNPMQAVKIGKVIVHTCIGKSGEPLERAAKIIMDITNQKPVQRKAKKTIRDFGIHRKEPISVLTTLRGKKAEVTLEKLLDAVDRKVKADSIDRFGNFSFGIEEHIDIPGMKYDPELGVIGLDVIVSLEKPGYRIKRRRKQRRQVPLRHRVSREEALSFLREKFGAEII